MPTGGMNQQRLMDGSSNGSVHFWTMKDNEWTLQKTRTFHKAAVQSIDIHSSGRVAFSLANDRSLVLWDLIKLRRAFSCKLAIKGEKIKFHPYQSDMYLISSQNMIYQTSLGNDNKTEFWHQMADIQDFCFWKEHLFLTVSDDGAIRLWDERSPKMQSELQDAHSSRIKGLSLADSNVIISGSSDGYVKLWDARKLKATHGDGSPLSLQETGARITCLASITENSIPKQKTKRQKVW